LEAALARVDEVLTILPPSGRSEVLPDEITQLVGERDEARKRRDYERADEIRAELAAQGFVVEDLPGKTRVKRRT
ncbi:MAG: cysteine--tRNA ligase, partial [Deltaproteobacteria bacterium]|nr:cysteine--tRNA ligase [Deltaproteobacteria bacterium]